MTCHDMGVLQAYLDGEVSREEKKQIMKHIESCQTCRDHIDELQSLHSFCEQTLEVKDVKIDTDQAWERFEKRLQQTGNVKTIETREVKPGKGWSTLKTKTKRYLISGVAAAAIFSSFAIPQVQVGASQFLSLFRVDQFEMVKLTQNDIQEIESWMSENKEGALDLKGIGKMEMSKTTGEPKYFDQYESAKEAGYEAPELEGYEVEEVRVTPASTITFTLNVEKTNQLLTQLGSEHQFQASLNEKPFSVTTYEGLNADYKLDDQHISYMRTKSPEINVPEGVSVGELRATMLSLPFLPENVKTQLAGIENFETTLPIPYVETEGSKVSEVRVGDAQGFTVEGEQGSVIVWQKNGDIHMIASQSGMDLDELTQLSSQIK
ncbi:anti-sigma factor family protein [Bacillus dakarensis]|uniref:anti-sigma factor family protein n=1 Tax=Robertmurraya dakarensis TaxID=1926278 RepID=UPI0009816269|nr:zf-HC2 domain-containing protein [Bacillus dakarensis]